MTGAEEIGRWKGDGYAVAIHRVSVRGFGDTGDGRIVLTRSRWIPWLGSCIVKGDAGDWEGADLCWSCFW